MKHLFLVRHGKYSSDYRLNHFGKQQMEALGNSIKKIVNGDGINIVTSTAPRALDSSAVLKNTLQLPIDPENIPYLWSGDDAPLNTYEDERSLERIMAIVNEKKHIDTLIMVSHLEVTEDFPPYFFEKEFSLRECIRSIGKGQAVHFNLEEKTYQILSPVV